MPFLEDKKELESLNNQSVVSVFVDHWMIEFMKIIEAKFVAATIVTNVEIVKASMI